MKVLISSEAVTKTRCSRRKDLKLNVLIRAPRVKLKSRNKVFLGVHNYRLMYPYGRKIVPEYSYKPCSYKISLPEGETLVVHPEVWRLMETKTKTNNKPSFGDIWGLGTYV